MEAQLWLRSVPPARRRPPRPPKSRTRQNLLDNVSKRGLKVDRIVPIHGTMAPFSSLVKAGTAAP